MKYLTVILALLILSACALRPVQPQASFDATRAAQTAIPPLPTMDDPVALPTVTPTLEPTAVVLATEEATQVACLIKGNVTSSGDKIFHIPGGVYYDRVKVDFAQGDAYFCTEGQAIGEGFRKSSR